MIKQKKLTTRKITPNNNISFPIGTILTVKHYAGKLDFHSIFSQHKTKGRELVSLINALVSYRLTENHSISKGSDWINRKEILSEFNLKNFEQRTLFRTLSIVGKNKEKIIADLQNNLFSVYDFENTDSTFDWTSLVLYGEMCKLAKQGYSRDHRPDKKQITIGISQLSHPINIPTGITTQEGNLPDVKHFNKTYRQVKNKLKEKSLLTFDKGANSEDNLKKILADKFNYLTLKKLNKSDDKRIKDFNKSKAELIDSKKGVYGIKFEKSNKIDYFYFSEELKKKQMQARDKRAQKMLNEAKEIQKSIEKRKKIPMKFKIKNKLIDIKYFIQTKLNKLTDEEALEIAQESTISGREGFFCIISSKNLTLDEALKIYRAKDSVEKTINSLKNEIEIKPLRVWTEDSIYGAVIVGFISQLIMSLIKYEDKKLKNVAVKFIKNSLMNLTVTIEFDKNQGKREVYANFNEINKIILGKWNEIT